MKNPFLLLSFSLMFVITTFNPIFAQGDFYKDYSFSEADTLRGMLRPERTCFDVNHYLIQLEVDIDNRSISGNVETRFAVLEDSKTIQYDLWENMVVDSVVWQGKTLDYDRKFNAVFVHFPDSLKAGNIEKTTFYYHGKPHVAKQAPWDGGFIWDEDPAGNPWIGVACEGDGASLWWPNKDHLSDEPESVTIDLTVPEGLTAVANGQLTSQSLDEYGKARFVWDVSYPINNYNVTLNIAKYAHFKDTYTDPEGNELDLNYYVLEPNLEKAKKQFKQVHGTLSCFGEWFDEYPFWDDGFKLVETPYLGMEHQSAIAYGNNYMSGYMGMHPPGFDFDYIIIHEAAHEWFGNSISCNDLSEMWIHESFATHMEALFVECNQGFDRAIDYMNAFRPMIANKEPILGPKDVNWEDWQHSDHYYKGSWMLFTLRNSLSDESTWKDLLKGFYQKHKISNIVSADFINYVNEFTGEDYTAFFEQYLEYPTIPVLEYQLDQKGKSVILKYRLQSDSGLSMRVRLGEKGNYQKVLAGPEWKELNLGKVDVYKTDVNTDLYLIKAKRITIP